MLELFREGGVFMYIILVASVIGIAVIIERFFYFNRLKVNTEHFLLKIKNILRTNTSEEREAAIKLCDETESPISSLLKTGIEKSSLDKRDIEDAIQSEAQKEIPKLEQRISALGTVGSVAPLLGLLGTVTGMIKSFKVMSSGNADMAALAGGISEALLTTAFGLMVAIPCVIFYNYFSRKVSIIINDMEVRSAEFIQYIKHG